MPTWHMTAFSCSGTERYAVNPPPRPISTWAQPCEYGWHACLTPNSLSVPCLSTGYAKGTGQGHVPSDLGPPLALNNVLANCLAGSGRQRAHRVRLLRCLSEPSASDYVPPVHRTYIPRGNAHSGSVLPRWFLMSEGSNVLLTTRAVLIKFNHGNHKWMTPISAVSFWSPRVCPHHSDAATASPSCYVSRFCPHRRPLAHSPPPFS